VAALLLASDGASSVLPSSEKPENETGKTACPMLEFRRVYEGRGNEGRVYEARRPLH
jgi:hypothetical protein